MQKGVSGTHYMAEEKRKAAAVLVRFTAAEMEKSRTKRNVPVCPCRNFWPKRDCTGGYENDHPRSRLAPMLSCRRGAAKRRGGDPVDGASALDAPTA